MSPGLAGTELNAFTRILAELLLPQEFLATTEIGLPFDAVDPADTVILLVVPPAVIFQPVGRVQTYSVAFVIAGME